MPILHDIISNFNPPAVMGDGNYLFPRVFVASDKRSMQLGGVDNRVGTSRESWVNTCFIDLDNTDAVGQAHYFLGCDLFAFATLATLDMHDTHICSTALYAIKCIYTLSNTWSRSSRRCWWPVNGTLSQPVVVTSSRMAVTAASWTARKTHGWSWPLQGHCHGGGTFHPAAGAEVSSLFSVSYTLAMVMGVMDCLAEVARNLSQPQHSMSTRAFK